MKNLTIESAKQFLKDNGYFTDNLWNVEDVKINYNCTDEEAQAVLDDVLNSDRIKQEINETIDIIAEEHELKSKEKSKYFSINGFWKDTNENFENRIVKELEELAEDDDENIFYYDLSEEEINLEIKLGWSGTLDFVITSYEETTLN